MTAVVLHNQVSTGWLVYPLRECYSNWGSVLYLLLEDWILTSEFSQFAFVSGKAMLLIQCMTIPTIMATFLMSLWEEWDTRQIGRLMATG